MNGERGAEKGRRNAGDPPQREGAAAEGIAVKRPENSAGQKAGIGAGDTRNGGLMPVLAARYSEKNAS